jgi:hypothetical protein
LTVSTPTEQVMQLSGVDDHGQSILSVVVKRTYRLEFGADEETARCVEDEYQLPLHTLETDPADPEIVVQDADIYPWKPLTDVIVRGHAYSGGRARAGEITAGVAVGSVVKALTVAGDRRCARSSSGRILISDPAPFERVPLRYDRAYGGVDRAAEARHGNPYAALLPYLPDEMRALRHSPYRYPRNGVGKGYVVEASAEGLEGLELPNLEDPTDRLTPERLVVGSPGRWPHMPLPWCTDWLSLASFPRIGFLGGTAYHDALEGEFPEAARGFIPAGYPRRGAFKDAWHARGSNAASLGLQVGPFSVEQIGGIRFRVANLQPERPRVSFFLPAGGPQIAADGRNGRLVSTQPVLHHVVIEPDLDRVSVLWRGSAPALRPYRLEELIQMPLSVEW